jgi:hypothetical protein
MSTGRFLALLALAHLGWALLVLLVTRAAGLA